MILSQAVVHVAAQLMVGLGFFMQCHTNAPHHTAENLAARHLRVDHAPGRNGADHTTHLDRAQVFVYLNFDKHRRVGSARIALTLFVRLAVDLDFQGLLATVLDQLCQRHTHVTGVQLAIFKAYGFCILEDRVSLPGNGQQLAGQRFARLLHGGAHGRHGKRAALQRRGGQRRIPQ